MAQSKGVLKIFEITLLLLAATGLLVIKARAETDGSKLEYAIIDFLFMLQWGSSNAYAPLQNANTWIWT